jgi:hypothetical protein
MTKVMKPEMLDPRSSALPNELLSDPVRIPRALTERFAGEDERPVKITDGDRADPVPLFFE